LGGDGHRDPAAVDPAQLLASDHREAVGDVVEDGSGLVVLEAMKMEHTLRATGSGTVREVRAAPGLQVDVGDLLVVTEPLG